MNQKSYHPKYKIKDLDTIQSITECFQVKTDIWKRYHNNMCRLDDIIKDKLPKHLDYIYLLPELWEKELILNREIQSVESLKPIQTIPNLGYQNTLFIKNTICTIEYGVKIEIQDEKSNNTLKYKTQVRWLEKKDDYTLVEVNYPDSLFINDELPDMKVDQLAVDVYKLLFPIVFEIDKQGCIIGIANFEEIKAKWKNSLEEVQKYRFGELLDKYLKICSYSLQSEKKLLHKLKKDYFIHCYFLGIYQTYGEQYIINKELDIEVLPNIGKVSFQTQNKIEKYKDRYGMIKILIDGKAKKNNLQENEPIIDKELYKSGNYFAKYFVNSENHIIDSMITKININQEGDKKIIVKISNIS